MNATGDPTPDEARTLAALTDLLRSTHLTPPDLLPSALDNAIHNLGAEATLYLADYSHTVLVPMPLAGSPALPVQLIDTTLAGRAYRLLSVQTSTTPREPHLWMPVIDGMERLGVLRVAGQSMDDLEDPAFLRACWWLSHYLGHLVAVMDAYGDGIDAIRRQRPRSLSAELVWQLLPPLTAGTGKVLVSGRLEPAGTVGGDVFDYALSEHTAQFALMDATGHDLRSGLAAATALAAYRNARRQGHGLFEQTESVHRAVRDEFAGRMYVTGLFAQLDLDSGVLRYLSAGHPAPLLLRGGRVVKTLDEGLRPLLGLDMQSASVAEEALEPDDIVVLYTDGIIEARDPGGRFFGVDRLVDFVERDAADGIPLPEIVRRVCRRILEYQNEVLQDDATVLMLQWTTTGQAGLDPTP